MNIFSAAYNLMFQTTFRTLSELWPSLFGRHSRAKKNKTFSREKKLSLRIKRQWKRIFQILATSSIPFDSGAILHTAQKKAAMNSSSVPILNIPVEFETDGTFHNVQRSETFQPEGKRFFCSPRNLFASVVSGDSIWVWENHFNRSLAFN